MKHFCSIILLFHLIFFPLFTVYSNIYTAVPMQLPLVNQLYDEQVTMCEEGFLANTLIKTPYGYTYIEDLLPHDLIIDHNGKTHSIQDISRTSVLHYVHITTDDDSFFVARHQLLYHPLKNQWIMAQGIVPGDMPKVRNVEIINHPAITYNLTIEDHLFCITESDLIAHNMDAAALGAGAIHLGYITIIRPVIAVLGATLALSKLSHDSCNTAQAPLLIDAHGTRESIASTTHNCLIERHYYERRKKELEDMHKELSSFKNGLTTIQALRGSYTSFTLLFLNKKIEKFNQNACLQVSSAQEHVLDTIKKDNVRKARDIELGLLEQEIVNLQLALALHVNELIAQKSTATHAGFNAVKKVLSIYNAKDDNTRQATYAILLELYKECLSAEYKLSIASFRIHELKLIIQYYKSTHHHKCLKLTTNILEALENQANHIPQEEKMIQGAAKNVNTIIIKIHPEVKEYCTQQRIPLDKLKHEIKDAADKEQKEQTKQSLENAETKEKQLRQSGGGPKKDDDDDEDKDKNKKQVHSDSEKHWAKMLSQQLLKARRALEKRVTEHIKKLSDYLKNPAAYDNKGFIARAQGNLELIAQIVATREKGLIDEIAMFKRQIAEITEELIKRGIS